MSSDAQPSGEPAWAPPSLGTPCWLAIPANDVARAKVFYQNVFGWKFKPCPDPTYTEDNFAFFTTPTPILMGAIVKSNQPTMNKPGVGIEFYLLVDDIDGAFEKAKAAGGNVVMEKVADGDHTLRGRVSDTEGNVVGVLKWLMGQKWSEMDKLRHRILLLVLLALLWSLSHANISLLPLMYPNPLSLIFNCL